MDDEDVDGNFVTNVKNILERLKKLQDRYVSLGRTVHDKSQHESKMHMAFVYTTRSGFMRAFGSKVLVNGIGEHQLVFSESPDWDNMEVMLQEEMELVCLSKVDRPLEKYETAQLVVSVACQGTGVSSKTRLPSV